MTTLHEQAYEALAEWETFEPGQRALRQAFLGFLLARPDAMRRSCRPGHLTASALVLSDDRSQTLLTLHPRVGRWLQLGGHCEPGDASLVDAALREATEESGLAGLIVDPVPLRLDVHPITCSLGVPTRHFDVQFQIFAPAGANPEISAESDDLKFWPVDDLPQGTDESVELLVLAAMDRTTTW